MRVRVTGLFAGAPSMGVVRPPCSRTGGGANVALCSIRASVGRRGVRRLGLGRTDGAADSEKQPTGLIGARVRWLMRRAELSGLHGTWAEWRGVATHRQKRCFERTGDPQFSSSSSPKLKSEAHLW
jgi:hypothetical protein